MMTLLIAIVLVTAVPSQSYAQAPKPVQIVTTSILGMSLGMMAGAIIATMSGHLSSGPVVIGAAVGFGIGLGISLATDDEDPQALNRPAVTQETSSESLSGKTYAAW